MNILFVHEVDYMKKVIYEYQVLPELLSLRGHNVYVVDYESMWQGVGISPYNEMKVSRIYRGAMVTLIRPPFVKVPFLSRVSAFVTHYAEIGNILRSDNIDAIILYSVPTNGLHTVHLGRELKIPVIFRSIDNLSELVPNRLLGKITQMMEKRVYSQADYILAISPRLLQYVIKLGAKENNVEVLPLGVDTGLYRPDVSINGLYSEYGLSKEDKIVLFVGTLPEFSGLDYLIKNWREVIKEVPNAKLLIVGDGEQRMELERGVNIYQLRKKVIFTGYQPQLRIPRFINMASVCVMPFKIVGATKDAFPTKVVQYMACGKPVVSTPLNGLKDVIKEDDGIIYSDKIHKELIPLLKDDDRVKRLGESALKYAVNNHSYDKVVDRLEEVIKGIL